MRVWLFCLRSVEGDGCTISTFPPSSVSWQMAVAALALRGVMGEDCVCFGEGVECCVTCEGGEGGDGCGGGEACEKSTICV